MLQSFLQARGLDAGDIEMLGILSVAFMPSVVGVLLAFFAAWLPDEGYVTPERCDDLQRKPHPAHDREQDWRRAA
jgi:hypothetical protein